MKKLIFLALLFLFYPKPVSAQTSSDWYMLGANPQRTSWVSEEVRGNLNVEWYRPIEPYIPYKVQPIFSNSKVFISTAKGLYCFSTTNGDLLWVFPTEMPLGHSPTVVNNIAYVGGYDRKLYAIDANTGTKIWDYTAEAGFETNPLVVNNVVYSGNRDGYFYALDAVNGSLKWRFKTDGPILFSAAYKDNTLYFASNDNNAYAINATTGTQIWKKGGFPGSGFHSFWPVVYTEKQSQKDYVIFTGAENYRLSEASNSYPWPYLHGLDQQYLWGSCWPDSCPGGIIWPQNTDLTNNNYWGHGVTTLDVSKIAEYYENLPDRHMTFILDMATGQEYSYDSNGNGIQEYAPFTYSGITSSGNKYPAVINGVDNVLYQDTLYYQLNWISRGDVVGWKWGDHFVSKVATGNSANADNGHAVDEPMAYSSGGKLIYWNICCDREAGAYDVTIASGQPNRAWYYFGYSLGNLAPDYRMMYDDGDPIAYNNIDGWQAYSGKNQSKNGVYSNHETAQSPPVPYQGKVYFVKGNALLAFSPTGGARQLSLAATVTGPSLSSQSTSTQIQQKLETEVQKMVSVGHLRPGYHSSGFTDLYGVGGYTDEKTYGEILDYFSNPSETVISLLQTLPYLSSSLQQQVKTYLQNNYGPGQTYDFSRIVHIGWGTGVQREVFTTPDQAAKIWGGNYLPPLNPATQPICGWCGYWQSFPPYNFYAAWKYASVFGNAKAIFDSMSSKIEAPPTDSAGALTPFMINKPYLLNQYLAGYKGYLELQQMAGYAQNQTVLGWYNKVQTARINNFSKDTPYWKNYSLGAINYNRALSVARNFMFLTPEIADIMNQNINTQVQTAMDEYQYVAPYWFVSKFDATYGEGTLQPLYDYPALFQARAYILKQPFSELVKYLDVPAFAVGDLFYIQNLVAALSASNSKPGDLNNDGQVDIADVKLALSDFGTKYSIFDLSIVISNFGK